MQYYLDRDDAGHSTLRTVETFVAVFPDFDQNKGLVRNIPITYGGTDAFDPRRVDTQLHIESVTDENGDPVYWETYDAGPGIYGMYIDDDTYKHGDVTPTSSSTPSATSHAHFDDTGDDEFYWDVNGTDWPQPFGTVSATVHLGDGLAGALNGDATCYRGEYGSDLTCPIEVDGDTVSVNETDVGSYQNVSLAIGFASGNVHARPDGRSASDRPDPALGPARGVWPRSSSPSSSCAARAGPTRRAAASWCAQYEGPEGLGVMPAATFLGRPNRGFPAQFVELRGAGHRAPDRGSRAAGEQALPSRAARPRQGRGEGRRHRAAQAVRQGHGRGRRSCSTGRTASWATASHPSSRRTRPSPKQRGLISQGKSQLTKLLRWPAFACFAAGWFIVFWAAKAGVASALLTFQLVAIILGSLIVIGFGGVPTRRTQLGSEMLEHLEGLRDYLTSSRKPIACGSCRAPRARSARRSIPNDDDAVIRLYEKLLPWAMVWGVEKQWQRRARQEVRETQTEPSNLQFSSGLAGLSGFATSAVSGGFAQTVTSSSYSGSGGGSSFSGGSSGGGFSGGGGGGGGGGGR